MSNALISILIAFVGYSLLNIAQATQKIGLNLYKVHKMRGAMLWSAATAGTSLSIFILLSAVSLGSVSIVGAMAGTGLASLAVFSALVMKERISRREVAGVIVILGAAALIGAYSREAELADIKTLVLFIFLGTVLLLYLTTWLILRKTEIAGLLLGGYAGALGGLVPMFQKVSTSEIGKALSLKLGQRTNLDDAPGWFGDVKQILLNPYALLWVVLSILSMLVLQFSYKKDRVIRIVPVFSANYIAVPVLGGVLCFYERLRGVQWLGVALIISGVLLISLKPSGRDPQISSTRQPKPLLPSKDRSTSPTHTR